MLVLLSLHLGFTLPCTEDVPTCGDSCDKVLECGIHKCSQRCHRGPCEICRQVSLTLANSHFVKAFKHCIPGTVQVSWGKWNHIYHKVYDFLFIKSNMFFFPIPLLLQHNSELIVEFYVCEIIHREVFYCFGLFFLMFGGFFINHGLKDTFFPQLF